MTGDGHGCNLGCAANADIMSSTGVGTSAEYDAPTGWLP